MTKVVKDGIAMVAKDKNQLAAFLNNGWKEVTEEKLGKVSDNESGEKDDSVEEAQGEEQPTEADPPKRGRKPTQK